VNRKIRASAVTAGALATAVGLAARRSGISVAALLTNSLATLLAPDQDKPGALEDGIARNRERGPALPPRRLRKRAELTDEHLDGVRVFRLEHRDATTGLRFLYLHGGSYVHEMRAVQWNLASGLLDRLPATLVAPVYPLAPEHSWRDGLAAAERVYSRLADEAGAGNVVVLGDSAGGGLALALAQQLRDAGRPLPAALVLFSPWLDISLSGEDQPGLEKRDPVLRIGYLRRAGELWADGLPPADPRVSPLFGDHAGLPPTIVFSGTRDVLHSDAVRLARANPAVEHHSYPEMMHVWAAAPIPEGKRALDEAAAFVRRHVA